MHESFYFQLSRDIISYLSYLLKRKFSGSNNSCCSHILPKLVSHIVGIISLSAYMDFSITSLKHFSRYTEHTWIRYKHSIHLQFFKLFKISFSFNYILIMRIDISCHIKLDIILMCILNSFSHFFFGKVISFCP